MTLPPAPPVPAREPEPAGPPVPLAPEVPIETVHGMPFLWPVLDAPYYGEADAQPFARLLRRWHDRTAPTGIPSRPPESPAAMYLAADLRFMHAAEGRTTYFAAAEAYGRALRSAPDFEDAARAHFALGHVNLALGLAPEARAAFRQLVAKFPSSPLVSDAKLGEAVALSAQHRPGEARQAIDALLRQASGNLLCRVRREDATLARAESPTTAAVAFQRLAEACPAVLETPGTLADYIETLIGAGDVASARRVLGQPRGPRGDEEEARLHLLAGGLADDEDRARREYDRVLGMRATPALVAEARMRLARLDAGRRPERSGNALIELARDPHTPPAQRAVFLGEAAESLTQAGRFDAALALLDEAAAAGPEGAAQAEGRRAEILGRWIASLSARDDAVGVATVWAAHESELFALASPEDRLASAQALGRIGLHDAAVRVLTGAKDPELQAALIEEALAAGDRDTAHAVARKLDGHSAPPAAVVRALARLAIADGDLERAVTLAGTTPDADTRTLVANALLASSGGATRARAMLAPVVAGNAPPVPALLAAGDAAATANEWDASADAYRRALAIETDGPTHMRAAAGLVRAEHARGDLAAARAALAAFGEVTDPVLKRAVDATRRSLEGARSGG